MLDVLCAAFERTRHECLNRSDAMLVSGLAVEGIEVLDDVAGLLLRDLVDFLDLGNADWSRRLEREQWRRAA